GVDPADYGELTVNSVSLPDCGEVEAADLSISLAAEIWSLAIDAHRERERQEKAEATA
ncbi:unnamed protein product, partial [marine sediment metagenome]